MKKLLSLLSILTISGTAIPTTIAASPYQKEETIKNNGINYKKINKLEKLNRSKKEINNSNLTPVLNIDNQSQAVRNGYWESLNDIIHYLIDNNIINRIAGSILSPTHSSFRINNNINSKYFIIPVNISDPFNDTSSKKELELVIRISDFYLQGFIIRDNDNEKRGIYYYFKPEQNEIEKKNPSITNLNDESIIQNVNLGVTGHYSSLRGGTNFNNNVSWVCNRNISENRISVTWAFRNLLNWRGGEITNNLLDSLFIVIFTVSESLRFHEISSRFREINEIRGGENSPNSFNLAVTRNIVSSWTNYSLEDLIRIYNSSCEQETLTHPNLHVRIIRSSDNDHGNKGCSSKGKKSKRNINKNDCYYKIEYINGDVRIEDYFEIIHNKIKIIFSKHALNEISRSFLLNNKENFKKTLLDDAFAKADRGGNRPSSLTYDELNKIAESIWNNFLEFHEKSLKTNENQKLWFDTYTTGKLESINIS